MAHLTLDFYGREHPRDLPADGKSKAPALVGLIAFVAVLATAAVTIVNRVQDTPLPESPVTPMSLAAPSQGGYVPITSEPEFIERFVREKRDAAIEELPPQF